MSDREPGNAVDFVRGHARLASPALVPELRLWLGTQLDPLWEATLAFHGAPGAPAAPPPPPYWAFAWVGGQALARTLLDAPELVRGLDVLDFGAGSGLVALAAARAGARHVTATDIDPLARAAIELNACENGLAVEVSDTDLVGTPGDARGASDASDTCNAYDVITLGDLFYEQPLAGRVAAWASELAARGKTVLFGDPGRTYVPRSGIVEIARYDVATTVEIETAAVREAVVWRVVPTSPPG